MNVVIGAALFKPGAVPQMELLALITTCRTKGHGLAVDPPRAGRRDHPTEKWLDEHSAALRQELDLSLAQTARRFVQASASTPKISVVLDRSSCWSLGELSVEDAQRLLSTPLRLLVENSRNDRDFLLAVLHAEHRRQLLECEKSGTVEFEHAGGIGEMKKRLEGFATGDQPPPTEQQIRRLRTWVMHDRDADPADQSKPSALSDKITTLCRTLSESGAWEVASCQLGRRTIESYLPTSALNRWAARRHKKKACRLAAVTALKQLREKKPEAAWVYDLKRGLRSALSQKANNALTKELKDNPQLRTSSERVLRPFVPVDQLDPVFNGLTPQQLGTLALGFGDDVCGLYRSETECPAPAVWEEYDTGPDHQWSRQKIGTSILERI